MIMTVLPLKRTPLINGRNHNITTHMEHIIDSHNWIMDIHNCTGGNRKYVCSIVDNNMWSPLWLSIIWLLIHNLNMNTHMHYSNMDIHYSIMDIHNKKICWHLATHHVITIIISIIIIIIMHHHHHFETLDMSLPFLHTCNLHALNKIFNTKRYEEG